MIYGNSVLTEDARNLLYIDLEINNYTKLAEGYDYLSEGVIGDLVDKVIEILNGVKNFIIGLFNKVKEAIEGLFDKTKKSNVQFKDGEITIKYYAYNDNFQKYKVIANKFLNKLNSTKSLNIDSDLIMRTKDNEWDKYLDQQKTYVNDLKEYTDEMEEINNLKIVPITVTTKDEKEAIYDIINSQNNDQNYKFINEVDKKIISTLDGLIKDFTKVKSKVDSLTNDERIKKLNSLVIDLTKNTKNMAAGIHRGFIIAIKRNNLALEALTL